MADSRSNHKKTQGTALKFPSSTKTFLAALAASESDQVLYGVDTAVKRLQNSHTPIHNLSQFKNVILNSPNVISPANKIPNSLFPKNAAINFLANQPSTAAQAVKHYGVASLMDGFWSSAANKAATRTSRYFMQDKLQERVEQNLVGVLPASMSTQQAKALCGGISGAMTGFAETIAFQPLDTIKTRKQIGSNIHGNPYAGMGTNALRSTTAAGLFFTFYNAALGQSKDKNNPTNTEKFTATSVASTLTTLLTNPLDVAKTRIQALPKAEQASTLKMIGKICSEEGVRALTKGVGLKLMQSPAKSVLPFFTFQMLKKLFDTMQTENTNSKSTPRLK